ncbi:MAG TPA: DUF72 domain-containing protein [Thermoleophilaceae bacterium]
MGEILVGTSSWADPGFVKEWYPQGLAARERLPWYARQFRYVELNSSFYAIPDRTTVHKWAEETPDDFVFDIKVHRALTRHAAQLASLPPDLRDQATTNERGRVVLTAELEETLARRLVEEVAPLHGKLGAFLAQLTPAFSPGRHQLEELDGLVDALKPHRLAVELRHRGWLSEKRRDETLAWFSERGVAFVNVDAPRADHFQIMPSDIDAVTDDAIAYLRVHGRNADGYLTGKTVAERFGWRYEDDELEEIAGRARALAEQSAEVHVAFNNNRGDDAPTAAQRFQALLGQEPAGPGADDPQLSLG